MSQYYVYKLINSLDNQPFYIGKGKGLRMYQHIRDAKKEGYEKRSVHCKIINILNNNGKILYEKTEYNTEIDAFIEEKRLITLYGRKDLNLGLLCNLTDGGEGTSNTNINSIEKRAAKHRGVKRNSIARTNMKNAQIISANERREKFDGKACSPETSEKMSKLRKGKPWSENAKQTKREKPTAKIVLVYKKDTNEFIGEWESISLCGKELSCDVSAIWKICKGDWCSTAPNGKKYPMKSFKGYIFKYKEV